MADLREHIDKTANYQEAMESYLAAEHKESKNSAQDNPGDQEKKPEKISDHITYQEATESETAD
jgi:hypothetical protein